MVTVGIVGITCASAMVLSARSFNLLKSANETTQSSQCLQERMEQLRNLGWMSLTSKEIPEGDDDDTIEDEADIVGDLTQEILVEPTEFPDDLTDTTESDPGLLPVMEKGVASSAELKEVVETVTVAKYPEGSTPIKVRRNTDGTVTVLSHNADLVYEDMVRVVLTVSWKSKNSGTTRTVAAQSIITKNTQ